MQMEKSQFNCLVCLCAASGSVQCNTKGPFACVDAFPAVVKKVSNSFAITKYALTHLEQPWNTGACLDVPKTIFQKTTLSKSLSILQRVWISVPLSLSLLPGRAGGVDLSTLSSKPEATDKFQCTQISTAPSQGQNCPVEVNS